MSSRSELHAARTAPNRAARIRALAELMREHGGGLGEGLTEAVAYAAGSTRAEIEVYRDAGLCAAGRRRPDRPASGARAGGGVRTGARGPGAASPEGAAVSAGPTQPDAGSNCARGSIRVGGFRRACLECGRPFAASVSGAATRKQSHTVYRLVEAKSGAEPVRAIGPASILAGRDARRDRPPPTTS